MVAVEVKDLRPGDPVIGQFRRGQEPQAVVGPGDAAFSFGVHPAVGEGGAAVGTHRNAGDVDSLRLQVGENPLPFGVGADAGQKHGPQSEPGRGDRGVGGGTAPLDLVFDDLNLVVDRNRRHPAEVVVAAIAQRDEFGCLRTHFHLGGSPFRMFSSY